MIGPMEAVSVFQAWKLLRAREGDNLIMADGPDLVRVIKEGTEESEHAEKSEPHRVVGVFNGSIKQSELRAEVEFIASGIDL